MAGIGFALRGLSRRDDLLSVARGHFEAALASAGPWLFTVLAIAGIDLACRRLGVTDALVDFRSITIYNFSFSLVLSGPFVLLTTRYLADRIYEQKVEDAVGLLFAGLAAIMALALPAAIVLYGFVFRLEAPLALVAAIAFVMTSALWAAAIFLTALKDYRSVTLAFGVGMAVAMAAAVIMGPRHGAPGFTGGFALGVSVTLGIILGRIFAEYPYPLRWPARFLGYFRRYPEILAAGLAYNLAIWIDKWIMWASPLAAASPSGLVTAPGYDSALFFAQLIMVPAMALFLVVIETDFFEKYRGYYGILHAHGRHDQLLQAHREVELATGRAARNILVIQATLTLVAVILGPGIAAFLDLPGTQIGIFRFAILGASCHVLLLFLLILFAYLDRRLVLLGLMSLFLALNAGLTLATLELGFAYYGYGYFAAALATLIIGAVLLARDIRRLPFLSFVRTNPAVRGGAR